LTRKDAAEFMEIAPKVPVHTTTQPFALEQANEALNQLRSGKLHGAAVLICK
jgi:propanol-preferring alcohol dehydrogenase